MGLILPQYIEPPKNLKVIKEDNFDSPEYQYYSYSQQHHYHTHNRYIHNNYSYNYNRTNTNNNNNNNGIDIDTIPIHKLRQKFKTYACKNCRTHLSSSQEIMSRDYRGKTGDAYLMSKLVNIEEGLQETRVMMTGEYLVCDINCSWCHQLIGWKYLKSDTLSQRYKEGRYIMELKPICITD
ncbi:hypothetical protein C6P45_004144 [Maudiozyma exigua]|uniref:Yippee domain-containing protein n=1 Tax=Maudiozyma exigua TaxID=34358 RepID=A0A9P6WCA2_MAUEX|nr:hypothetical protein C6P45_004144 [Kazachstania exigua]